MDGITCLEENTERDQRALAVGVHRACFLCGNTKGEQLFEENWEVVSIGSIRIGVRICSECGLVLQDPVAPPSVMFRYYEQLSNYRNPGRSGLPSKDRITAVDRQLAVLNRYVKVQGRALQVGCADGYTLHRFKQAGWSVAGVDPSPAAAEVAKTLWGLRTDVGFFEDYRPQGNSPYDLIILTHVLEHIYDPIKMLKKCYGMVHPKGHLLIEVPALVEPSSWPAGYFTFEHINYFSMRSMTNMLTLAGFEPIGEFALAEATYEPVMACVVRPKAGPTNDRPIVSDFPEALRICRQYMALEPSEWRRIDALLRADLRNAERVLIWGAGIHTSQLLARTGISDYRPVDYIVDSDSQKWGLTLGEYPIKAPREVRYDDEALTIVISSYCSEAEIYKAIASRPDLKAKVVRLYGEKENGS